MAPKKVRRNALVQGVPAHRVVADGGARNIANTLMSFDVSVKRVAAATGTTVSACNESMTALSRADTPFGPVRCAMDIPDVSGGAVTVHYNNPFALLWAVCERSKAFGTFLERWLRNGANLIIYSDETTPGNQKRPDHGRSYEALLFTFKQLPSWFVCRKHGFFKFSFVMSSDLEQIDGGMPSLIKAMLYKFFSRDGFNMKETGCKFPTEAGEAHITCEFGFFGLDERAGKFTFSVKGASGAKCCLRCLNVVGAQTDPGESDFLVHYTEHRRARWRPTTAAHVKEMKAVLDAAEDNILEELQLMCGLIRDPHGLLWDEYIADLIDFPRCMYWDNMHCKFASGGTCQYLVNGFARELTNHGISLETLDSFTKKCRGHKLYNKFWSNRIVPQEGKHIKGVCV